MKLLFCQSFEARRRLRPTTALLGEASVSADLSYEFVVSVEVAQFVLAGAPCGGALLALVAANVYVMFFNFSWGPVMWVMLGEMFPNQIRGSGLAVSGLFQWGSNFGITMTFPILLGSIGLAGAYGIYTVFAAISILFVIRMVRETRGRELEDMTG